MFHLFSPSFTVGSVVTASSGLNFFHLSPRWFTWGCVPRAHCNGASPRPRAFGPAGRRRVLYLARRLCFAELYLHLPAEVMAHFAAALRVHDRPLKYALVLRGQEDLMDAASFDFLLDRLTEPLATSLASGRPSDVTPDCRTGLSFVSRERSSTYCFMSYRANTECFPQNVCTHGDGIACFGHIPLLHLARNGAVRMMHLSALLAWTTKIRMTTHLNCSRSVRPEWDRSLQETTQMLETHRRSQRAVSYGGVIHLCAQPVSTPWRTAHARIR